MTDTLTDPQTLTVEYDELMARADELEAPLPGLPLDIPFPPSNLAQATGAAAQLKFSGEDMRRYLAAGQQEWYKLAESLRNAAKAYEEVDEGAAEAIENDTMVSAQSPSAGAAPDIFMLMMEEGTSADVVIPVPDYYPVSQAAYDIAEPDQGAAFDGFAAQWSAFQRTLVEATARFRPFEYWDGDSTYAVEATMAKHRDWLFQMADLCQKMATQAREVASAQRWALPRHPTAQQISELENAWYYYQTEEPEIWPAVKIELETKLAAYQEISNEVLGEYETQASLPLSPAKPPLPPTAGVPIPPPSGNGNDGDDESDDPINEVPDLPGDDEVPVDDGVPYDPGAGSGGSSGAGVPSDSDTDSLTAVPPTVFPEMSSGAGVKPASVGGGGFGGGGGIPAMPMQPSTSAVSVHPAPPIAQAGAVPGVGGGPRAPMGAGGAGMPMGGGAGGQNQTKQGKRMQQDDEALYTEDRPWTASVIGNRRRNDAPEM